MLCINNLQVTRRDKSMGRTKPCVICRKPTSRILFQKSPDEVVICSKRCQNEYFQTISPEKAGSLRMVTFFDEKIANVKRYEVCCWITAGLGVVILVLGACLVRTLPLSQARTGSDLFLIGTVPLTIGALATEYFSGLRRKLMEKRRQIG
jgi:hypothetical protein